MKVGGTQVWIIGGLLAIALYVVVAEMIDAFKAKPGYMRRRYW